MWQKFREFNDATFTKRSEEFEQQKREQGESDKQATAELNELEAALNSVEGKAQLLDLQTKVKGYMPFKSLTPKVSALLSAIDEKLTGLAAKNEQANLNALFVALENNEPVPSQFTGVVKTSLSIEQLLTRMEILANVSSHDSAQRMVEQVAMLDDKHRGDHADLNYYLKQLIALSEGSVKTDTLARLKVIFAVN